MLSRSVIIARNNVQILGSGPTTLMFAHGFGCDQNMWRYITPAFKNHYRIVLFDYVGAGKSDMSFYNKERYSDLNGYAEDILEIASALELSHAVFVGHSVSSMIGLLAALKQPGLFSHLILVGPSPCYINYPGYVGGFDRKDIVELLATMEKNYIGWANFLAPAIMKNPEHPELGQELTASFCSTDPIVARQFAEATFFSDNRDDLAKVKTPSLILQCSDDLIAPLAVGEYLRSHLPDSTLKVLKATGHCPHMSAPEETIEAIQQYFAKMKI
jgi:sigma-B regulation protein RsbQ